MTNEDRGSGRQVLPYQIVLGVVGASIGGVLAVLGELREELGFTEIQIGIVVAAGFLASFVAQIGFARFSDRGHGREMATIGMVISAVALFAMVVADSIVVWSVSRAAVGFAGGLIVPGVRRAVTVLDPERVGENLGRLVVGEILGFVLGPAIAAGLVAASGLRAPFLVFSIGTLLFIPFVMRLPADSGAKDSGTGRTALDLLGNRRLQGSLILVFGYFMLIGTFEAVLPVMFQDRGGGAVFTGIAFTAFAIPMALVSTPAGRFADRVGAAKVATLGVAVVAVSAAAYGFLPGLILPSVMMATAGVADGFGFTASQVAVSRAVAEDRQAGALGLMGASEVLGAGLAAIPSAALYGRYGATVTWPAMSAATLFVVLLAHMRLRGTEPVSTGASDLAWTPVDRHPEPRG